MKKFKKPILFYSLTGVSIVLLTAFAVGYGVTSNYTDVINKAFQLESTKNVEVGGDKAEAQYFYTSDYENSEELKNADKKIAEELTEEGSVLLKNTNNALPLSKTSKVTLLGHSSCNTLVCGTGSADIKADGAPTLYETLTARGVSVNKTVWDYYVANIDAYPTNPKKGDQSIRGGDGGVKGLYTVNEIPWATLAAQSGVTNSFSEYNDAAIVVVSRLGGEMYDLPSSTDSQGNASETVNGSGNSLELTINEIELINQAKQNFNKVIVLINSANPLECDFLTASDSKVDAALWIGYTGLQGLEGVADLLVGNSNPSGRLVDTYCNDNTTAPAMKNFYSETWSNVNDSKYKDDMTGDGLDSNKYFNAYQEGIYVGYRYYETRYEDYVYNRGNAGSYNYLSDVAYPFGFGLSYSTFEYSDVSFKEENDNIVVSLTVKNTSDVAGKDVIEVYSQSEYTDYDKTNKIEKSAVELCGFAKTKLLEKNQTESVSIIVPKSELVTYDTNGKGTYILDQGNYYISLGHDAHDALNNIIAKKGNATNERIASINGYGNGDAAKVYQFVVDTIDDTTYSTGANGEKITNQFENSTLEYYGQTMTMLSRSDWETTFPTHQNIALNDKMHQDLTGVKDYVMPENTEKMPTMGANNGKQLIEYVDVDFDENEKWDLLLDQLTYDNMCELIGVGYHGTVGVSTVGKPQTKDENGPQGFSGSLTDLTGNAQTICAYTDENIMAATWNTEFMEEVGKHIGNDGLSLGYSGLYGPAMNTHRSAYAGRNFEYYSEDGFLAGKIAASEVKGIQSKGVYVFIKHFALNDCETNCRSISTFTNEQATREIYLKPFEIAVKEGGAYNVMTSFARVGVTWSSAHSGLMTNVLRNEWGMKGFAVSDYTNTSYGTSVHTRGTYDPFLAVPAGTDTFDSSDKKSQYSALKRQQFDSKGDAYMVNRMRLACKRILYVVVNSNAMNGFSSTTKVITIMNWWQFALIDGMIYSGVLLIVFGTLSTVKTIKAIKFAENIAE